jgi:biotin transport system permease protein
VTPTLFLYHPTPTPLHRFGAGPKLAVLVALSVLLFAVTPPVALAAIGAVAVIVTVAAGPSVAVLAGQLRFPAFIVALVALANALLLTPADGLRVALRLGTLLVAAAAVTSTTRVGDVIAVLERLLLPFERLGLLNAQQVALSLSLAITLVPLLFVQVRQAREAQIARGAPHSLRALTTPLLVRVLKSADELAEAIDARGFPRSAGTRGSGEGAGTARHDR